MSERRSPGNSSRSLPTNGDASGDTKKRVNSGANAPARRDPAANHDYAFYKMLIGMGIFFNTRISLKPRLSRRPHP